ncbi:MAG: hypothetical protein MRY64_15905 [Hyphomonadaceae bacterium]|nr:hypothetical protein [Hyphomonadaceae bacterium]
MLILLPVLSANVVSGIFATRDFPQTPRPAALEATRTEIKARFASLASSVEDRRDYWASLVALQLRERNMPAARGFLLAATEMLDPRDREAVTQAGPQAVPFGTEDEQLVGAALLFLPNDVRVRYETALLPPSLAGDSETEIETQPVAETSSDTSDAMVFSSNRVSQLGPAGFSVLGSYEDLVRNTRDWLAGEPDEAFALRITALGLMAEDLDAPANVDLREAASLLKAADRARRLSPGFREHLSADLELALPLSPLRARMADSLAEMVPLPEQAEALHIAFQETLQEDSLGPLYADTIQINEIVDATGPVAALAMLEHVDSIIDLRRARLVAEAGGDRSIALEAMIGRQVLNTARTGVDLTRQDVLEIMGLAAAAMALFWMVMLSMQRYMRSPIRPLLYE